MTEKRQNPIEFALEHVQQMQAYVPGSQDSTSDWVKINTNENPYPPSPKVVEAIQGFLAEKSSTLRLYPNPISAPLRQAIATHHGLEVDKVIVGNGCDDILNLLMRVFSDSERQAGMMDPSYSLYSVLNAIQSSSIKKVPFDRSMNLDVDAIIDSGTNIFFLTNPNAPTGVVFPPEKIEEILSKYSGILVVDETYAPFANSNSLELLKGFKNLVITRSFSKAYALAGMRVGYGLASAEVIDLLDRVRDSYNLDCLAQVAAVATINDDAYYQKINAENIERRERCRNHFEQSGWFVYPSQANFLFLEPKDAQGNASAAVANSLFEHFKENKILVRYFPNHALTKTFLRISVGSESEMDKLLKTIETWQKKG